MKSLQLILILLLLIITIIWASYFIFNNNLTRLGKIASILIMCGLLSILYKYIKAKYHNNGIDRVSTCVEIIYNIVFWLPCFMTDIFDFILHGTTNMKLFSNIDTLSAGITAIVLALSLLYINMKKINQTVLSQNGDIVLTTPIYLDKEIYLPFPIDAKKQTDYAISFWVYFHSTLSNPSEDNFSIMNMCNDECIVSYTPYKNTMDIKHKTEILYEEKMLPQKWNNVILNFTNSSLDIFINGKLKYSKSGVLFTLNNELLKIGQNNGIQGGIRDFTCYNNPLTFLNVFMINNTPKII